MSPNLSDVPLVDLQVNGGWGVDFSSPDASLSDFRDCCEAVLANGTAAFLATMVSSPLEVYRRNLPMLASLTNEPPLRGRLLGTHLEGPFIPADDRVLGAHRKKHVRACSTQLFDDLLELSAGALRMLTLAAEQPRATKLIRHGARNGVVISVGHSHHTIEQLDAAQRAGARILTHLGNALPNVIGRRDNPWYTGLLNDDLSATFIADGHHLSASMLEILFRCKTPQRLIAVSDAAPIAGLPPGRYHTLGQAAVLEPSGRLVNVLEDHLVGSSASLVDCLNTLLRLRICGPAECVRVGSVNPMAVLGLTRRDLPQRRTRVAYDPTARRFAVRGE